MTGAEIQRALVQALEAHPNIRFLEHHQAIDLITTRRQFRQSRNRVLGAYFLNTKNGEVRRSRRSIRSSLREERVSIPVYE